MAMVITEKRTDTIFMKILDIYCRRCLQQAL
jgi:hypothetical protein